MFKVMIVDDEPMMREGLVTLIDWELYGFGVVQTAASGKEALEKYDNDIPDLMIVDIKMPRMSGLELIERIREKDRSINFLILSGYAEFEYAKKAMTHDVEGYLLKPVDEDELIDYLKNIKEKMEKRIKENEENKNQILQAALKGNLIKEVRDFFQHDLNWDQYQILLIKVFDQNNVDIIGVKQGLQRIFEDSNRGQVFIGKHYFGVLLNDNYQNEHQRLYRYVKKALGDEQIDFVAAIAQPVKEIELLPKSFEFVSTLIKNQFFYDEEFLLHKSAVPFLHAEKDCFIQEDKFQLETIVEKLYYAIEIGNKQAIERVCIEIGSFMVHHDYTEQSMKERYVQIISSLLNKLLYEYQDMQTVISETLSRVLDIEKQTNIKSLLSYIYSLLDNVTESMDVNNTDVLVKRMIGLIERNYNKNITLTTLAEVLNYNSAYLGKLFKDFTGEYFNTYLDKIRIENGKKLLLEGYKVYEVAEQIGYSNVDYFHSKFRSYEGISPSAYRKTTKNK